MDATPAQSPKPVDGFTTVESIFVRHRNCLMLTADFSSIFTDHYLLLMQNKLRYPALEDGLFKDLLAFFTLHLVSRPWKEYHAWTLNLCQPAAATLFVSGSSLTEDVIGRVYSEGVKVPNQNIFFTQNIVEGRDSQNSIIHPHGESMSAWIEDYYLQSEQRQARAFHLGGDQYALFSAEPGADHDWLDALDAEYVSQMVKRESPEETKILETRRFYFRCGCTLEKIIPTIRALMTDLSDIINKDGHLEVSCPRCGVVYIVKPQMLMADTEVSQKP